MHYGKGMGDFEGNGHFVPSLTVGGGESGTSICPQQFIWWPRKQDQRMLQLHRGGDGPCLQLVFESGPRCFCRCTPLFLAPALSPPQIAASPLLCQGGRGQIRPVSRAVLGHPQAPISRGFGFLGLLCAVTTNVVA